VTKGGTCSFCAIAEPTRGKAIARWKEGDGVVKVTRWLETQGVTIGSGVLNNCLTVAGHHGSRMSGATSSTEQRLGKIAKLLEDKGIDVDDVGEIKSIRISEWQSLTKNDDGDAEIHDLAGSSIVLTPAWEMGPKWQPVDRAPVTVGLPPKPKARKSKWKRAVILPDVQIGYRMVAHDAQLDPFHDERAMAAALRVTEQVDPDIVLHLGDFLDFAQFGTFEQEPGFALTVQPAIDRAHRFLAECKVAAPNAHQVLLEGNHDRRLQKAIVRNAVAAFGITRANAPEEWPVLSVPYLLRLDELGVEYVGGYPAGIYWFNDRICAIHGHKVRSAGSTAAAVVDDERISVIFGHVHRIEESQRTRRVRDGYRTSLAATPGCLCRIDGTVPSTKGSTDVRGQPIPTAENWQHGMAVLTYQEGDGKFEYERVTIHDGEVIFRGAAA
jgi:predicted phosphodiesterase